MGWYTEWKEQYTKKNKNKTVRNFLKTILTRKFWPWSFILLNVLFVGFFIADITTTMMVGPARTVLETNPLYSNIGFTGIILLNLFIWVCLLWLWYIERPLLSFFVVVAMLLTVYLRCLVIPNAIFFIQNPISIEQAEASFSPEMKDAYFESLGIKPWAVLVMCTVAFFIYHQRHHGKHIKTSKHKTRHTGTKRARIRRKTPWKQRISTT